MRLYTQEELTGKSDDCSNPPVPLLMGPLRSGLGALPWNELIELLTLLVGVGVWLSVNPSFSSFDPCPLPCSDAFDPATEPVWSAFVAAAAFSWFFLLLKRKAIVRRSASGRLSYYLCRARADDCVIYANAPKRDMQYSRSGCSVDVGVGVSLRWGRGCGQNREKCRGLVGRWLGIGTGSELECAHAWRRNDVGS